jgi:hypothetical protein
MFGRDKIMLDNLTIQFVYKRDGKEYRLKTILRVSNVWQLLTNRLFVVSTFCTKRKRNSHHLLVIFLDFSHARVFG